MIHHKIYTIKNPYLCNIDGDFLWIFLKKESILYTMNKLFFSMKNLSFLVIAFSLLISACSLQNKESAHTNTPWFWTGSIISSGSTSSWLSNSWSLISEKSSFFDDRILESLSGSEYVSQIENFSDFTGSIGQYALENITSTGYIYRIIPKDIGVKSIELCFLDIKISCSKASVQWDGSYVLPFSFRDVAFPQSYAWSQIGQVTAKTSSGEEISDTVSAYFTVYNTKKSLADSYICLGRVCVDQGSSSKKLDKKIQLEKDGAEMDIFFDLASDTSSFRDNELGWIDYKYVQKKEYERFMWCGAGALSQIIQNPTNTIDQDIILGKMRMRPLPWNSFEYTRMLAMWGVWSFTWEATSENILSSLIELTPPIKSLPSYIVQEDLDERGMLNSPAKVYALNFDNIFRFIRVADYSSGSLQDGIVQDVVFNNQLLSDSIRWGYMRKITSSWADMSYEDQQKLDIKKWKQGDDPIFEIENVGEWFAAIRLLPWYEVGNYAELCKPAIYDYSLFKNQVVTLHPPFGAQFTKLIPDFTENLGWKYNSLSSGDVLVGQQQYPYLYYSIKVPEYRWLNDGVVVRGGDMDRFFRKVLWEIGFRDREQDEFIDYWKNEFDIDKLYTIAFHYNKDVDAIIPLSFEQPISRMNRVLLEAQELPSGIKVRSYYEGSTHGYSTYVQPLIRSKDDVFEWGGTLLRQSGMVVTH